MTNRRIVLASRPQGEPSEQNFRMEEAPVGAPGEGQVLLRTIYLSLDPYMRGRMNAGPSYAPPVEIGGVMEGATVGEIVQSRASGLKKGEVVLARSGWQEYEVADAKQVRKLNASIAPVSTALGVLGMPGLTAYTGLLNIGQPKEGETVAVAAAAGPVGSAVGQIAKLKGCRAVGIAGGKEKCDFVVRELQFDACVDRNSPDFEAQLQAACPKGIDVYFENVGGSVFRAVMPLLNLFSRIPVCGLISQYNATELPEGPDRVPQLMALVLVKRLTVRGYIVTDFWSQHDDFQREMSEWVRDGKVRYREDFVDGLESAPRALIGLLRGDNFGKLIVRVGEPRG